ncbi:MAG: glycosyltransferase family 25 protein [Moraxellaceae bacterium]|nr:glycosyltransferase family 25 protein [Moraxellaceae bacterium]
MTSISVGRTESDFSCPIYVISLPGSDQRRQGMTAQLFAMGLLHEFVDGVRGSELSTDDRSGKVGSTEAMRHNIGRDMTAGEIGCALSHQNVYDKILAEGHDYACVLEDDARLLSGFREVLAGARTLDFDVLILGYPKLADEDVQMAWLYDPVMPLGAVGPDHVFGVRPRQSHLGMVGYLVSRRGCEKLKSNFPVVTVADDHPFFSAFMRIWHVRPFVVMEDTVHVSTIRGDYRRNRFGLSMRQRVSRALRGLLRHLQVLRMKLTQGA